MKNCKNIFHGIVAIAIMCLVLSCKALHSSMGNVRVCFYGQVVDQNANPIPDAKIRAAVRHWIEPDILTLAYGAKKIRITAKTDKGGRFKLHGANGDALGIEGIEKTGYELETARHGFSPVSGSLTNPVIFKMRRTNIHEQADHRVNDKCIN